MFPQLALQTVLTLCIDFPDVYVVFLQKAEIVKKGQEEC
jgi:hypothetical protein